jgi:hypothetical protein
MEPTSVRHPYTWRIGLIATCIMYHVSCIMYHVSCIKYHVPCIMYHVPCIMYHVSCIMYHVKAFTACVVPILNLFNFRLQMSVLRIRDILAQIRILGSVPLTNGPQRTSMPLDKPSALKR